MCQECRQDPCTMTPLDPIPFDHQKIKDFIYNFSKEKTRDIEWTLAIRDAIGWAKFEEIFPEAGEELILTPDAIEHLIKSLKSV